MKRWSLLFMPQPKRKRKRINKRERYRIAGMERDLWFCLAFGALVGGVFLYFILSAALELAKTDADQESQGRGETIGSMRISMLGDAPGLTSAALPKRGHPTQWAELKRLSTEVDANASERPSDGEASLLRPTRPMDGKMVVVQGFMVPLKFDRGLVKEFLLLKERPVSGLQVIPKSNDWIIVEATNGTPPVLKRPITVRGQLSVSTVRQGIDRFEVYRMQASP